MLEVLLSFGFDVNEYYSDTRLMTCLHLAIKNHHYNAIRWLVQHGADCNKPSKDEGFQLNITPIGYPRQCTTGLIGHTQNNSDEQRIP